MWNSRILYRKLPNVTCRSSWKLRYLHTTTLRPPTALRGISENDRLKNAFDNQQYWTELNIKTYKAFGSKDILSSKLSWGTKIPSETGLFNNPDLTSPKGLLEFSKKSLEKAQGIVDVLRSDHTENGLRLYISNLDLLSDTLCRVIDLCEFVRSSHPDEKYVEAAQDCYEQMFEFMNMLNTDVRLCYTLKHILEDKLIISQLSDEELKVGKILLDDFEKSGIYMEPKIRNSFIQLSQSISVIGQDFINHTDYVEKNEIQIKSSIIDNSGMDELLLSQLKKDITAKYYKIPTYGYITYSILKSCPSEEVRKQVWTAVHNCSKEQIKKLTDLIRLRANLASLLGKNSYSEYQLEGKMAKSPLEVKDFVQALMDYTKPLAAKELKHIATKKLEHEPSKNNPLSETDILQTVKPWDRVYYLSSDYLNDIDDEKMREIVEYFTLGNVFQGLSNLFKSIYGISLEIEVPKVGETWSPEVRKLNVISEAEGLLGVVYCDLFERSGKTMNAAHFTICCSRDINPKETDMSTIQLGTNPDGTKFQLPIISLVCNFSRNQSVQDTDICFLNLKEIETLFHEMGHAMHSMLGRTKLQNTSGTRCATDFVELPSILMEHFARDIRVLETIGKHYLSNDKVPRELLQSYLNETKYLEHCETYSQAKMAMLDQVLHSESIIDHINDIDIVELYHQMEKQYEVMVDDRSNWCGKFGHLFGYGAVYYSYLFDRAIAAKVWDALFKEDPFNRENGQKFANTILKWGGSKDPWKCIADALDMQELAAGDSKAIKYIGSTNSL